MKTNDEPPFQTPPDLRYIPIKELQVNPAAQRKFRQNHANKMLARYNPDFVDIIRVSERRGSFYINDGQHTCWMLSEKFGEDFKVLCWVKPSESEAKDAQRFLGENDTLGIASLDKFLAAVTAGDPSAVAINNTVESLGLSIGNSKRDGVVGCTSALIVVYRLGGTSLLYRTLNIINEAYGTSGMDVKLVRGLGHVLVRYHDEIEDDLLIMKLRRIEKGYDGLLHEVAAVKYATNKAQYVCAAMAIVSFYNAGRGGKKLPAYA